MMCKTHTSAETVQRCFALLVLPNGLLILSESVLIVENTWRLTTLSDFVLWTIFKTNFNELVNLMNKKKGAPFTTLLLITIVKLVKQHSALIAKF